MPSFTWRHADNQLLPELRRWIVRFEPWCITFAGYLATREPLDGSSILVHTDGTVLQAAVYASASGLIIPVFDTADPDSVFPPPPTAGMLPGRPFSIMGRGSWVERLLLWYGYKESKIVEYILMTLDQPFSSPSRRIPGVAVQAMGPNDLFRIEPLQTGYELEEVLLDPRAFSRRVCRNNLKKTLASQHVFAALDRNGTALAKANTNTLGICHEQIGGVYTLPSLRGQGLGALVIDTLVRDIESRGKKPCLFVKKDNPPAVTLYRNRGFESLGRFIIAYPGRNLRSRRF